MGLETRLETPSLIIGNDFFVFYKLPLPSTLLLPPCSTAVPTSPQTSLDLRGVCFEDNNMSKRLVHFGHL